MPALGCPQVTVRALLRHTRTQPARPPNGHLVLAARLRPVLDIVFLGWEAFAELTVLEVGDGVFAVGDILGEEVVEVVVDERVVDTAGIAEGREEDEAVEEVAEAASWSLGRRRGY